MSTLISIFQDIILPAASLIQRWRKKRREEKRAWRLKIVNMRAELSALAPANVDCQRYETLQEAMQVYSQLDKYVDMLVVELQGTLSGIRRASYFWQQLGMARYYLRLLQTEKALYDAEQFRQFYADVFGIIDTMMCRELRLTPKSDKGEYYLLSFWYIMVSQQLMSVAT